jgi:hypothetical protein
MSEANNPLNGIINSPPTPYYILRKILLISEIFT